MAILLRVIIPDPDWLPISIWTVATSLVDELFVIAKKSEEVGVGWAVVVFQKCKIGCLSWCARLKPSRKITGERVEKRMMVSRKQNVENFLP